MVVDVDAMRLRRHLGLRFASLEEHARGQGDLPVTNSRGAIRPGRLTIGPSRREEWVPTPEILADRPREENDMPKKEIVKVDSAAGNPNLSPAVRFGNLVFVAGQTGRHPVSGEIGKDVREQTRNILERIKVILAAAGTSLDNVVTATTYLTRREDLAAYNEEYGKYFPTGKPARTTVTVASLNAPELLIEITVTACIPG
jgi:reactive intermediate/imine deaminase